MASNDIPNLLKETSGVEFCLSYPVKIVLNAFKIFKNRRLPFRKAVSSSLQQENMTQEIHHIGFDLVKALVPT
jgi:hypothetical protein